MGDGAARVWTLLSRVLTALVFMFSVLVLKANVAMAAKETVDIPVPKSVIFSGQLITGKLLRDRRVPLEYVNRVSVFGSRADVVGMVARTTLMPNQPIFSNAVTEPNAVTVNRPTIMEYSSGALTITAEVLPLVSAKAGEFVRARNIQSGVIVSGVALKNGMIMARALR